MPLLKVFEIECLNAILIPDEFGIEVTETALRAYEVGLSRRDGYAGNGQCGDNGMLHVGDLRFDPAGCRAGRQTTAGECEAPPVHRGMGSYPTPGMRLLYSAGGLTWSRQLSIGDGEACAWAAEQVKRNAVAVAFAYHSGVLMGRNRIYQWTSRANPRRPRDAGAVRKRGSSSWMQRRRKPLGRSSRRSSRPIPASAHRFGKPPLL